MASNELNEKVIENDCKKVNNNISYNVDYELYYNLFLNDEAFEEGETEEEKEIIRTLLYQKDLLAIFNMNKFDDDIINKKIHALFLILQQNKDLLLCMKELSK